MIHLPVFGVNDGIYERVVDGGWLGDDRRQCFRVGRQDACMPEKPREKWVTFKHM